MWKLKDENIGVSTKLNIMSVIRVTPKGGV